MREDEFFMETAIRLAERGRGMTSPNPMVGAVVVKNNRIIASGYHKRAGFEHAEATALRRAGARARGADLYVNLEPCSHFGRTPPCTEAIARSGVRKVFAAIKDPNPVNNGKGLEILRKAGVKVAVGVLQEDAKRLNEIFIKYIKTKRPFVIVKAAQSLDGKIATRTGESKWISSDESRRLVHKLRGEVDAVMVGANTVIKDDPLLRVTSKGKNPIKVIVDTKLKIPFSARMFSKSPPAEVILATTRMAPKNRISRFKRAGNEVLVIKEKNGAVDLCQLMDELGRREITSVMAEGGGELIGSLVEEGLVDKFLFFIAPKIIGGRNAITSVEGKGISRMKRAPILEGVKYKTVGRDLLIEGYLTPN